MKAKEYMTVQGSFIRFLKFHSFHYLFLKVDNFSYKHGIYVNTASLFLMNSVSRIFLALIFNMVSINKYNLH